MSRRRSSKREKESVSPKGYRHSGDRYEEKTKSEYYSFNRQQQKIPGFESPSGDPEVAGIDKSAADERKSYKDVEKYQKKDRKFTEERRESYDERREQSEDRGSGKKQPEREMSVTPTKDEVSDRLGLEDISPEEHDPRNFDYRLKTYGRKPLDDGFHLKNKKYAARSRSKERTSRRGRRESRSPDEYKSVGRRERMKSADKYKKEKKQESSRNLDDYKRDSNRDRSVSPDGFKAKGGRQEGMRNRSKSPEEYKRDGSREVRRFMEERNANDGKEKYNMEERFRDSGYSKDREQTLQIEDDYCERRIVAGQKPERNDDQKSIEEKKSWRTSHGISRDQRQLSEVLYDPSEEQEKRSIVIMQRNQSKYSPTGNHEKHTRKPEPHCTEERRSSSYRRESKSPNRNEYSRDKSGKRYRKSYSRSRSSSPKEEPVRIISVKSKNTPIKEAAQKGPGDWIKSTEDIFADLPDPKNDMSQNKFSTYVPRSVKLKNTHEKGLNPEPQLSNAGNPDESSQPGSKAKVEVLRQEQKPDYGGDDQRVSSRQESKDHGRRSRDRSRSGSKERYNKDSKPKVSSKKHERRYKRSRSRSRGRHSRRSHSQSRSSSRSRSRRSRDRRRKRSRSSSRSSRDHKRSRSKRSRSRRKSKEKYSRSRRSRSRDSRSRSKTKKVISTENAESIKSKLLNLSQGGVAEPVTSISSKWDSPEEKKSRWEGSQLAAASYQNKATKNMMAYNPISQMSSSPPPHRKMKPSEKKALQKKWNELNVPEEEIDPNEYLNDIVKQRAKDVADRISNQITQSHTPGKVYPFSLRGQNNMEKQLKLQGLPSKWDTDSGSDDIGSADKSKGKKFKGGNRSRSRSRSKERSSRKKGKTVDKSKFQGRNVFSFPKRDTEQRKEKGSHEKLNSSFDKTLPNPLHSKWDSDEEKEDMEKQNNKDSLNELEAFYNRLKTDKKRKLSSEGPQAPKP